MTKPENILQNRLEYFKNKDSSNIYDIYSKDSPLHKYFGNKKIYSEHFNNLVKLFMPLSLKIYKITYNNDSNRAEVLFLEKVQDLVENKEVNYYSKAFFILEDEKWKILEETRESSLNKGL